MQTLKGFFSQWEMHAWGLKLIYIFSDNEGFLNLKCKGIILRQA